ncbi:guanylate-binding protein 1-like isoform X1 [Mercenaria mercenaria]|uniref:guanylate-binding protein 1-like isoform X1 n=1 Tax=Mercenaria mercenaria TaxID=6596 RepID=UPI00234EA674|nr:guanylate-binding protein 1-like isoform X1 [Mercenaria mercenaria]
MCLISTSEDGKLQVEQGPLKQIKQIDVPLVTVAIAGLYRTGKSYLLNRLAGSSSGFPLGKTIESKTKGIWVWCKEHPKKPNTVLLLLDTEGLGDVAKGDSGHDNRVFTIAALLSNVLVYNMMSAFNQDAVEKLTFITEMSKNIRFSNAKDGINDEELGLILPTFVLCLRDFSLVLEKDGLEITPDEYLEDSLQLKCGNDISVMKYNRPRECIRKYFPKRKCFVFDRPGDRKTMQKLESVPFEKLSESFIEETELFLEYMYTCGPKVLISSKAVNGRMFVSLVENYVNAIRNGAVPDVDDAIMVVANIENERMASEAVQIFKEKIELIQLPILHTNNFEELYRDMQKAALANFRIESMFNAEKFEKQAVSEMDELWEKIKTENLQLVREHCESLLQALYYEKVGEKMRSGEYKVAGGYPLYKLDIEAFKKDYMVNVKGIDGYEAQQVLIMFMDKEAEIESNIMLDDKKMTEEDRQRELDRIQTEHKEAQVEQRKLFETKLEEEKERAEEHQRNMEEERKEYMKKQEEKLADIQHQWDQQREISETEIQMMREENEAQKKEFQEKINKMADDHKQKEEENRKRFDQMLKEENEKAEKRIADVRDQFQTMLDAEAKKTAEMEKNLQLQMQEIEKEKKKRKEMEKEHIRAMEAYDAKIEKVMKESQGREDKMNAEVQRLREERDEYRKQSQSSGLSILDFIPVVNVVARAIEGAVKK